MRDPTPSHGHCAGEGDEDDEDEDDEQLLDGTGYLVFRQTHRMRKPQQPWYPYVSIVFLGTVF